VLTQRHVTLVVFPVHNCFASLCQYAFCSHYNRSSLVDRSTVTHLPCIDLDPHSCSILAFLGHLHDVRFIMYHLYHFYTPSLSILAPPNYPPCSISDPFPFVPLLGSRTFSVVTIPPKLVYRPSPLLVFHHLLICQLLHFRTLSSVLFIDCDRGGDPSALRSPSDLLNSARPTTSYLLYLPSFQPGMPRGPFVC